MMIFRHHRRDTHQVASIAINAFPDDADKAALTNSHCVLADIRCRPVRAPITSHYPPCGTVGLIATGSIS